MAESINFALNNDCRLGNGEFRLNFEGFVSWCPSWDFIVLAVFGTVVLPVSIIYLKLCLSSADVSSVVSLSHHHFCSRTSTGFVSLCLSLCFGFGQRPLDQFSLEDQKWGA